MTRRLKVAVVYGVPAGAGGLGQQVASILHALAPHYEVHALGPGRAEAWPLPTAVPALEWHRAPACVARWRIRYTWLRRRAGRLQLLNDRRIGAWAVAQMSRLQPDFCYVFTQVGLETLQWARASGVTSILESPNGHLRNYREVCLRESRRRGARTFHLHPSLAMLSRVESEYALADRIRVSSEWSKASLVEHGLDRRMIEVFQQPLNLSRFQPPPAVPSGNGPLRICFVGSLDLRKGFVYLLQAIRRMGAERVSLEIVGATGDRLCRRLIAREGAGLMLRHAPGDPLPALQRAELMVSPTLEDGSPFAVAEAMACGLPVITTECCGASEWVRPGKTGWIVPGADVDALVAALEDAIRRRDQLHEMGAAARRDTERRADLRCLEPLREWIRAVVQPERPRLTA